MYYGGYPQGGERVYSKDIINRVRDHSDIVDVISGYLSLKKTGKNHIGLCPFHSEKTPSFNVNSDKQIFHCFGCGVGGDVFTFLEMHEGLNFAAVVETLANRAGMALPKNPDRIAQDTKTEEEHKKLFEILADAANYFQRELAGSQGTSARAYLNERGINDEITNDFGLGYARAEWENLFRFLKQKGHTAFLIEKAGLIIKRNEGEGYYDRFRARIMFPIRDLSGHVIAFGGRVLDDALPKYLNSPETPLYSKSNVLYCLDRAKEAAKKQGYFIIVEGYFDALACHQYGVRNVIATLGTALTPGHLRLMRRFAQKLVLIFDPDPAGIKATMRGFDSLIESGMKVNVVSLPDGEDPDTFLRRKGSHAFAEHLKGSVKFMDFVLGQIVQGGSSASIDQKVQKAGEMLGFIAKLSSAIERDYYLKRTAEALDLDENIVRQEIPRQTHQHLPDLREQRENSGVAKNKPRAEEVLIHLMLNNSNMALQLKTEIQPEDFTDPLYRRVAEKIFAVLGVNGTVDIKALLQEEEHEVNRLISHYSVLEMNYDDPEKHCRDCVDLLKQQNPEKKIRLLVREIREAETQGDETLVLRLMQEQNELIKRPGRRIPGK